MSSAIATGRRSRIQAGVVMVTSPVVEGFAVTGPTRRCNLHAWQSGFACPTALLETRPFDPRNRPSGMALPGSASGLAQPLTKRAFSSARPRRPQALLKDDHDEQEGPAQHP